MNKRQKLREKGHWPASVHPLNNRTTREKEFLVIPGEVRSQYDGDVHYVSASRLMYLYGVHAAECVVEDPERPVLSRGHNIEGLLHLEPRFDGNYVLGDVLFDPCIPYQQESDIVQREIALLIQTFMGIFP